MRRACATAFSPTPRCAASTTRRAKRAMRPATLTRYARACCLLLHATHPLALRRLLACSGGCSTRASTLQDTPPCSRGAATQRRTRLRRRPTRRATATAFLPPLLSTLAPPRTCTPRRRVRLALPRTSFIMWGPPSALIPHPPLTHYCFPVLFPPPPPPHARTPLRACRSACTPCTPCRPPICCLDSPAVASCLISSHCCAACTRTRLLFQ